MSWRGWEHSLGSPSEDVDRIVVASLMVDWVNLRQTHWSSWTHGAWSKLMYQSKGMNAKHATTCTCRTAVW